jgi:transcription termination factor Rho
VRPSRRAPGAGPLTAPVAVLQRTELEQSPLADLHALAAEVGIEGFRRLRREELIDVLSGESGGSSGGRGRSSGRGRSAAQPASGEDVKGGGSSGGRGRSSGRGRSAEERSEDDEGARPARPARRPRQRRSPAEAAPRDRERGRERSAPVADDEEPTGEEEVRAGVLDVLPNGSGFLRSDAFRQGSDDAYVAPAQIRRCELRSGDDVSGPVRSPRRSERHPSLVRVETVNGGPADPPPERPLFEELTPVFAAERLTAPEGLEKVPFGKGSRVAVLGPPGAGATTLLRGMVSTLSESHPELTLTVLLAGVRPEEVTEWRQGVGSAQVAGGAFDSPPDERAQTAEAALAGAKRATERGEHSVLVVDGLETLATAAARQLFGSARNTEQGGSLTVIAAGAGPDLERYATTRIVLESAGGSGYSVSKSSGTLRPELLG